MAQAIRQSVQDFIRDVGARGINGGTSQNLYAASLNSDGSVSVSKNGIVIFAKVVWPGNGVSARTDASGQNEDTVNILDPGSQNFSTASAQTFINNLV